MLGGVPGRQRLFLRGRLRMPGWREGRHHVQRRGEMSRWLLGERGELVAAARC